MAENVGCSSDDGTNSGGTGESESPDEGLLHNYFMYKEYPFNTAVVYNDGNRKPIKLNYGELDDLANQVQDWVLKQFIDGWCVGVCVEMSQLFPALQIGIMRTGNAVCNMLPADYCETATDLRNKINLEYVILDRKAYMQNEEWIKPYQVVVDKLAPKVVNLNNEFLLYAVRFRGRTEGAGLLKKIPKKFEFAYVMQTTGTTGNRKTVLVPHSSIVPNVQDFISQVWECESNDVIFGSSPATFDPAMVELFAALGSGASILYVPSYLKMDGIKLASIFIRNKVTIFSTTPSLFRRLARDLTKHGIFEANLSFLKVISFGGEKCPSKQELRQIINEKMSNRLRNCINVYGVTEVSCWASYCPIRLYEDYPISLGMSLSETNVGLCFDREDEFSGEIVVESKTRVCTILNESGIMPRAMNILSRRGRRSGETCNKYSFRTGDIGSFNEFGQIEFEGRVDDVIKRSGMKVPLHLINDAAMRSGAIEDAHCVFFEDKLYLLIIPKLDCSFAFGLKEDVQANFLPEFNLERLPPAYYPDCIIAMFSIPLNDNGKVNIKQVLATIRQSAKATRSNVDYKVPLEIAEDIMESMWKRLLPGNPPSRIVRKGNFLELGGKSLDAVKVIDNVFQFLKLKGYTVDDENRLLSAMFALKFSAVVVELKSVVSERCIPAELLEIDHRFSIKRGPKLVPDPFGNEFPVKDNSNERMPITSEEEQQMYVLNRNISQLCCTAPTQFSTNKIYEYDLKMCVDAKVAVARSGLFEGVAIVGSYSGHVVALSLNEVQKQLQANPRGVDDKTCCLWCIMLPDAVEAEATFTKDSMQVFVACHNKRLYAISVPNGKINASSLTPGTIRTKPLLTDMGDLIVCMDDTNTVTCLDSRNLSTVWTAIVQEKTFSTYNLVVSADVVCISTSMGSLIALSTTKNLRQVWTSTEDENEYSTSPVGLEMEKEQIAVICGTKYGVKCLDIRNGKSIWEYRDSRLVDHSLPPTVHKCDIIPVIEIFIITKRGRMITFNGNGEKLHEFYVSPTNSTPLYMCKRTLERHSSMASDNDANYVNKYIHVLLNYPAKLECSTRHLIAYHVDNIVKEEICFRNLPLKRDSFSSLVKYKDLVIFGARDNKVHVVQVE